MSAANRLGALHKETALLPRVKTFLESIQRNSIKTRKTYETGLAYLNDFLRKNYTRTIDDVVDSLLKSQTNVYELLDGFVKYIHDKGSANLAPYTIRTYLTAIKSYLAYYDIDIIPSKFNRKVKVPKVYREDEEPLDVRDIRNILLNRSNRRMKAYLLVLASGGLRAVEGTAIRLKDIDFVNPTKIHIRKEYAKTRTGRDIYISDEATKYLKDWIDWKYRTTDDRKPRLMSSNQDDLVFQAHRIHSPSTPRNLYFRVITEFHKSLDVADLNERKEGMIRRKITLHSFRRFVKTVISDQVNQDYSEWFLGHNKSPYYTKKEPERREIYATKCMKYLTFLDYTTLEATGKNIESKLSEKEKEIQLLRQRDFMNTDAIATLSDKLAQVMQDIEIIKKQRRKI
jgi:integrase